MLGIFQETLWNFKCHMDTVRVVSKCSDDVHFFWLLLIAMQKQTEMAHREFRRRNIASLCVDFKLVERLRVERTMARCI